MWGHTGNFFCDTQLMAASPDGWRSGTVSIITRLTPTWGDPDAFKALRRAEGLTVCVALAEEGSEASPYTTGGSRLSRQARPSGH